MELKLIQQKNKVFFFSESLREETWDQSDERWPSINASLSFFFLLVFLFSSSVLLIHPTPATLFSSCAEFLPFLSLYVLLDHVLQSCGRSWRVCVCVRARLSVTVQSSYEMVTSCFSLSLMPHKHYTSWSRYIVIQSITSACVYNHTHTHIYK